MSPFRSSIFLALTLLLITAPGFAQSNSSNKLRTKRRKSDDVTVKGRITQNEKKQFQIDLTQLTCVLNQQVELPQPPVPEDEWPKMTPKQQAQWVRKFEASEEFKTFMAKRKKVLDAAERFEIQIEENGNFVVYDVPPGNYGLRGRLEKVIDEKNYVFEVFGQIGISEKVEEVLLDPMQIVVTRLAKVGEALPTVNIKTFDRKATINNKLLSQRNVLVYFWSLNSKPSVEQAKLIQQLFKEAKKSQPLQLLSICLDSDRKKALKHVVDNKLDGWHGYAENWEHPTIGEFGVRIIPAAFLLGNDGKIKMTQWEFRSLIETPDTDLAKIIVDVLEGKSVPTPIPTAANKKDGENQK